MAAPKQSMRQISDAAVTTLKGTTDAVEGKQSPTKRKGGTRPENFVGDRKGFFRGARIR